MQSEKENEHFKNRRAETKVEQPEADSLLDTSNFRLFVFQPDEKFYHLNFEDRLKLLEEKIIAAQKYILNQHNPGLKAIFVAPEYLFKDLSKLGEERYFSHDQKKKYIEKLAQLSKNDNMILAPGTLCWRKQGKDPNDDNYYYRNAIYYFYQGEVKKYKKANPHEAFDYDYLSEETIKFGESLFKRGNDPYITKIGGLSIGTEICYDHTLGRLDYKLGHEKIFSNKNDSPKIDLHLIVADGVNEVKLLNGHGILTIKIERRPDEFRDVIGTNIEENPNLVRMRLDPAEMTDSIDSDLKIFKFKQPQLLEQEKPKPYIWSKEDKNAILDEIDIYLNRTLLFKNKHLSWVKKILVESYKEIIQKVAHTSSEIKQMTIKLRLLNLVLEELHKNDQEDYIACKVSDKKLQKLFYRIFQMFDPDKPLQIPKSLLGKNDKILAFAIAIAKTIENMMNGPAEVTGKKYYLNMSSDVNKLAERIIKLSDAVELKSGLQISRNLK